MAEVKEHAEMMHQMPAMMRADPNMMTLEPSETGELIWQFTQAGRVNFACLKPGHCEAGIMGAAQAESPGGGIVAIFPGKRFRASASGAKMRLISSGTEWRAGRGSMSTEMCQNTLTLFREELLC